MRPQSADRQRRMVSLLLVVAAWTAHAFSSCPSSVSIIESARSRSGSEKTSSTAFAANARDEKAGKVNRLMEQRLKNVNSNLNQIEHIIGLTKRGRKVYVPEHLSEEHSGADHVYGPADTNIRREKKQTGPLRNVVRSLMKATGLSLVIWKTAAYKPSSVVDAACSAPKVTTTPYEKARVIAPSRYPLSREDVDKAAAETSEQEEIGIKMTYIGGRGIRSTVIATARGGAGARVKRAAAIKESESTSASYKMRNHIINLAASTQSAAQSGIDVTKAGATRLGDMHPKTKAVGGAVAATMIGVGIGVEVVGRRGDKNKDDSDLSNTDKLRKEIMEEIDWYEKKYGTGSQKFADPSSEVENGSDPNANEVSDSVEDGISRSVRKPDPQAQVRAIIENAKEAERRARIERRASGAAASIRPNSGTGVDYSKVKGLSTKAGEGKDRVQLLMESTAEMERRAEAQRLENARMKDLAGEPAHGDVLSLKIQSFPFLSASFLLPPNIFPFAQRNERQRLHKNHSEIESTTSLQQQKPKRSGTVSGTGPGMAVGPTAQK